MMIMIFEDILAGFQTVVGFLFLVHGILINFRKYLCFCMFLPNEWPQQTLFIIIFVLNSSFYDNEV